MNPDAEAEPVGPYGENKPNSPRPGNVREFNVPDDTGFLIVRFKRGILTGDFADLRDAARKAGLLHIDEALKAFNLSGIPVIAPVLREKLRKLEEQTAGSEFAPDHSLLSYWRIDVRQAGGAISAIEKALRLLPEVDLVYREKTVTDPLVPNPNSVSQGYLDPADGGVNARWVWDLPYGKGEGMHFIDLEQEWTLNHQDLPSPTLIFNDNRKGQNGFDGNHGTGVLGIVAGVDNTVGIIGMAPKVASVRVVSRWSRTAPTASFIAQAITVALTTPPLPHVLLIEAQTDGLKLPPETDETVFNAIRTAVASGVIVIETAGNGNRNLDFWADSAGQLRLNRNSGSGIFKDSGAILIAAATASLPHERSIWGIEASNFGSRIDCYAWGDSIVTCGAGVGAYRSDFGGTSGAGAIIAGCAILVQGLHFGKKNSLLSPAKMREMLSFPGTGIAPGGTVAGFIGVMPNLRKVVERARLGPNFFMQILKIKSWKSLARRVALVRNVF